MFALSEIPLNGGNNHNGREMYSSGRFMTITGCYAIGSIKEATRCLVSIEKTWFASETSSPANSNAQTEYPSATPRTDEQVQRVQEALACITPDCAYERWRNIVWAILSTGWDDAVELARDWSKRVELIEGHIRAYEEATFDLL